MSKHQGANQGRNSPRWAFLEKFVIPDVTSGKPYLIRWRLIQTPLCGVMLHKILLPDGDMTPHNHPYAFVSLILKGGYTEHRNMPTHLGQWRDYKRFSLNFMPRSIFHRIQRTLHTEPCWTLVFHGPRRGEWGFMTPEGFVESSVYFAQS